MENSQVYLLKNVKKFLSKFKKKEFHPKFDSNLYFVTTTNYVGSYILKRLSKFNENFFSNISWIVSDFLGNLNYINYKVFSNVTGNYEKIIVTWAFKKNFLSNGTFNDRYFNVNSKDLKKTHWFVIYMDDQLPKQIDNNITILKTKTDRSFNILRLLSIIFSNFFLIFKNIYYYLFSISNYNFFSDLFIKEFRPYLNNKIKYLLMPYEGQPFQNSIKAYIETQNLKIKVLGYIHSPPLALPLNLIHKKYCPDKIILNGNDQAKCFTKHLGWKKKQIKILPSFRFLKKNKKNNKKIIFLPLILKNLDLVIENIEYLIKNKIINIQEYETRNHPASKSKVNLELIHKINKLKNIYTNNSSNFKYKNYLIFIGSSGAIIEALERGEKVLQIVELPLFDLYSEKLWPSISTKKICKNVYLYKLKKKGNLIKLGNKIKKKDLFNLCN